MDVLLEKGQTFIENVQFNFLFQIKMLLNKFSLIAFYLKYAFLKKQTSN